jgi:hypothetical protein
MNFACDSVGGVLLVDSSNSTTTSRLVTKCGGPESSNYQVTVVIT